MISHFQKRYFDAKHHYFSKDVVQGSKWSHPPSEERCIHLSTATKKLFGLCCICKESRATSVLSRMMNESQQITQSLTIMLTWRRQIARLKRTGAFMRERHVGGKIWEFHFSSPAILAHPPTTFDEHSEPWMERWAERRLPLTHPPTVRKFLGAIMQRGGRDPAFMVNLFFLRKETQSCAWYSRVVWVEANNTAPLRDQAFIADSRAQTGQRESSGRRINH